MESKRASVSELGLLNPTLSEDPPTVALGLADGAKVATIIAIARPEQRR
jgi:hypothetical protein